MDGVAVVILSTIVLKMSTEVNLFWAEEGLELGVGFEDVFRHGAEDIDAEVMVFRVVPPHRANAARWGPRGRRW